MNIKNLVSLFCLLILASACSGGDGGKSGSGSSTPRLSEETQAIENPDGTYLAAFQPLNKQATGTVLGALTLVKEEDFFLADIRLNNANPGVAHRQNIYIGKSCPDASADVNNDGFIDIVEARPYIDSVLIPLDGDLNSQAGSSDYWPLGDQYGSYLWGKTASYTTMMNDLTATDSNADDDVIKLNKDQALSLVGKLVLIQGVAETTTLPETVATMGRFSKHQTLPIACGVITRVKEHPGVIDLSDEVAGMEAPTGETVGGSSGAEDGAIYRYSTGGTSGGMSF